MITKAVTAPFSLLANLVGSDEELNHIDFRPGVSLLGNEEQDRLAKLAKALQERPKLKLSVAASVNEQEDSRALAEFKVQQDLLTLSGLDALPASFSPSRIADSAPIADALEALAKQHLDLSVRDERAKVKQQLQDKSAGKEVTDAQIQTTLHIGLYNQLVNATAVSRSQLQNLAEARAKNIKAYLVDTLHMAPERVFLLDSKTQLRTQSSGAELTVSAE